MDRPEPDFDAFATRDEALYSAYQYCAMPSATPRDHSTTKLWHRTKGHDLSKWLSRSKESRVHAEPARAIYSVRSQPFLTNPVCLLCSRADHIFLVPLSTLVDTEPSPAYAQYIREFGLEHKVIPIAANKDGQVKTTIDSLCEAISFLLDPRHHPVWIHCNQGRHRTGCVVACLRKVQDWPLHDVLAEYDAYAAPKARPADIQLITDFHPEALLTYAEQHSAAFDWLPRREAEPLNLPALVTASSLLPHASAAMLLNDSSSEASSPVSAFSSSSSSSAGDDEEPPSGQSRALLVTEQPPLASLTPSKMNSVGDGAEGGRGGASGEDAITIVDYATD